jgi:UTP--glucose-1-phosphate uridylyltransferase
MEDHFDKSPELEAALEAKKKTALLETVRAVSKIAKITFTRQAEPLGLGHAVLMAKEVIGDEPFAVILPDDIVDAEVPCMKQMVEAFHETQCSILGSEVVEGDAISSYGCLDCTPDATNPRLLAVKTMVEKPAPGTQPSQNAIIGRYILTPRIFEMIEQITPGAGGELQLTDAIKALLQHEKVYGYSYAGKRHDAGDKQGFLRATVELGLKHPQLGPALRTWLQAQKF